MYTVIIMYVCMVYKYILNTTYIYMNITAHVLKDQSLNTKNKMFTLYGSSMGKLWQLSAVGIAPFARLVALSTSGREDDTIVHSQFLLSKPIAEKCKNYSPAPDS